MWNIYKGLKRVCREVRDRLVGVVPSVRSRGSRHKLEYRFCLNIRKHFCAVQMSEHWQRLPGEVVGSPKAV